jgi:cell wall-associated NlpC family hydrolase
MYMNITTDWGDAIAHQAAQWAGKEFRAGVKAQCMEFVRYVLDQIGHAYADICTKEPRDGQDPGRSFANSLCGRDLGQLITDRAAIEPGDILFWDDTYNEGWPPGTITHVGIAYSRDEIIHRPTVARPVERIRFEDYLYAHKWRCALRVPQERVSGAAAKVPAKPAAPKNVLKIEAHSGKLRFNLGAGWRDLDSLSISADYR